MTVVVTAVGAALIEGATAAVILTAVSEVGIALSVVGKVTGSKELSGLGKVMAIAGGVGSLANGALSLGAGMGEGVAEGATAGAYSDVAGEQFAQSVGQDAAGSGFGAAADAGASGFTTMPIDMGPGSAAPTGAPTTGIIGGAQNAPTGVVSGSTDLSGGIAPDAGMTKLPGSPSIDPMAGSDLAKDANGMYTGQPTPLADAATPTLTSGIEDLPQTYGTDQGTFDSIKAKAGKMWDSMSPQMKMELVKSALAIPGGIQSQKNAERSLDIQQQSVNQHSFGSQVPTFGIINKPRAG